MRERINRLANGIIDNAQPELVITPAVVDMSIKAGEIIRLDISLASTNTIPLKGLAYSSNYRVKVLTPKYGGMKNTLTIEIDARFLEYRDSLEGFIDLVSNAGEFQIPFTVSVLGSPTAEVLGSLVGVEDFTAIAKEDEETALRIFEYKDFVNIPFMQDFRRYSLYQGLAQRSKKSAALEEFLVALGAKKRAGVTPLQTRLVLENLREDRRIAIPLLRSQWGHLSVSLETDVSFLSLPLKKITKENFSGNEFSLPVQVLCKKLLKGKNTGRVLLKDRLKTHVVTIEAYPEEQPSVSERFQTYMQDKKHFRSYMEYRLKLECCEEDESEILAELMALELESTSEEFQTNRIRLLIAEAYMLAKKDDRLAELLSRLRKDVMGKRQSDPSDYIFMEYLSLTLEPGRRKRESLTDLAYQLLEEYPSSLFYIILRLDESLQQSPALLNEFIIKTYGMGIRSPFLYMEYIRLLNRHPEFLHDLGDLALSALYFGMKNNLLSEGLVLLTAARTATMRNFRPLCYPLLKAFYDREKKEEYVAAICRLLIKGEVKERSMHEWYARGVELELDITGLYEYYIHTLPENYDRLLPDQVFAYFSSGAILDSTGRARLYENILRHMEDSHPSYGVYFYEIERFALAQLRQGKMDRYLAYIYAYIIKEEMIDADLAKTIPAVLSSYVIYCDNPEMRSVILIYPELKGETHYPLEEGITYMPIFSDSAVLLLEDGEGNRYAGDGLQKSKIVDMPRIVEHCYRLYPGHIMLRIHFVNRLLALSRLQPEESLFLEETLKSAEFSEGYRNLIFARLVRYYNEELTRPEGEENWRINKHEFLIKADKRKLTRSERESICETFITLGYVEEAYEMIKLYSCFGISTKNLARLCERLILDRQTGPDVLLLYLCLLVHRRDNKDSIILDYLCRYYNGSTQDMYRILSTAVLEHAQTHDMEERLLTQMLFTGYREYIDQTFAWYVSRKKSNDLIVQAFFAVKSSDFVLFDKSAGVKVFEYLEAAVESAGDKNAIPLIYQIALIKYYAGLEGALSEERRALAQVLLNNLIGEGLVFPFYKDLGRYLELPADIRDKAMVMFHSEPEMTPRLYSKISGIDHDFREEEFKRMYQNIFIKSNILFERDIWDYQIFLPGDEKALPVKEGRIEYTADGFDLSDSRFVCLNRLTRLYAEDEGAGSNLKEKLQEYVYREELASRFFGLMQ